MNLNQKSQMGMKRPYQDDNTDHCLTELVVVREYDEPVVLKQAYTLQKYDDFPLELQTQFQNCFEHCGCCGGEIKSIKQVLSLTVFEAGSNLLSNQCEVLALKQRGLALTSEDSSVLRQANGPMLVKMVRREAAPRSGGRSCTFVCYFFDREAASGAPTDFEDRQCWFVGVGTAECSVENAGDLRKADVLVGSVAPAPADQWIRSAPVPLRRQRARVWTPECIQSFPLSV